MDFCGADCGRRVEPRRRRNVELAGPRFGPQRRGSQMSDPLESQPCGVRAAGLVLVLELSDLPVSRSPVVRAQQG